MILDRCYEKEENMNSSLNGCGCAPIMECPQERVIHREICYNVPHIIPINTRVVNHHIYRHTYEPCFTCTEENEVCNVYDNPCHF